MKILKLNPGITSLFFVICFYSCKKDSVALNTPPQIQTEENSDATVFSSVESDITKLILRPGPGNGQDVYADKLEGIPTGNQNHIPELPVNKWTNGGIPLTTRSFIRFDSLAKIPVTSKIIKAQLYLYGLSQSLNTPQGNSWYPGSPYEAYGDNSCLVQGVLADWDETTLTFDNQPATTAIGQATLAASTSQWNYNGIVNVTNLVRKMVANPSRNFGFCIRLTDETAFKSIVFASSESTERSLRPRLVITYK